MTRFNTNYRYSFFASLLLVAACAYPAWGVPVQGQYQDNAATCDNHGSLTLTHELGNNSAFPTNEAVFIDALPSTQPGHFSCANDDGLANEFEVRMQNLSGQAWTDVFFVADDGFSVGNFDGDVQDLAAPGFTQAFRIDALGTNTPLVFESMTVDNIFEVGESWTFLIDNFSDFGGPVFGSVGKFSFSSAGGGASNASILARLVPEPASAMMMVVGTLLLGARARRRAS